MKLIADHQGIPEGARIELDLNTLVKPSVIDQVNRWLDQDPDRRNVTWVSDPTKPLIWAGSSEPTRQWTPTGLRDAIFEQAGVDPHWFSAADAWCYQGQNLYGIAEQILAAEADKA